MLKIYILFPTKSPPLLNGHLIVVLGTDLSQGRLVIGEMPDKEGFKKPIDKKKLLFAVCCPDLGYQGVDELLVTGLHGTLLSSAQMSYMSLPFCGPPTHRRCHASWVHEAMGSSWMWGLWRFACGLPNWLLVPGKWPFWWGGSLSWCVTLRGIE